MGDQAAQEVAGRRVHGPAVGGDQVVAAGGDQELAVRTAVRDAVASLPQEQRQVVEMAYFGGYTHTEIAEMARLPLGTVKGRMRLALEKMGSYLRGRGLVDV